jgi:hypothetical protein
MVEMILRLIILVAKQQMTLCVLLSDESRFTLFHLKGCAWVYHRPGKKLVDRSVQQLDHWLTVVFNSLTILVYKAWWIVVEFRNVEQILFLLTFLECCQIQTYYKPYKLSSLCIWLNMASLYNMTLLVYVYGFSSAAEHWCHTFTVKFSELSWNH